MRLVCITYMLCLPDRMQCHFSQPHTRIICVLRTATAAHLTRVRKRWGQAQLNSVLCTQVHISSGPKHCDDSTVKQYFLCVIMRHVVVEQYQPVLFWRRMEHYRLAQVMPIPENAACEVQSACLRWPQLADSKLKRYIAACLLVMRGCRKVGAAIGLASVTRSCTLLNDAHGALHRRFQ
jgi:hypothetical protein